VETLPPQALAQFLDVLSAAGARNVVLGGGEPAEWPWGWELACRMARERGFLVQLGTAGVALRPGFERVPWADRFVLPLDGDTPGLHNRFRPTGSGLKVSADRAADFYAMLGGCEPPSGHFAVIMDRLAALAEAGREVTLSTVVNRESLHAMDRLAGLVENISRRMPVHAWHLYQFIPAGRGGTRHADRFSIDRERFNAVVARTRGLIPGIRIFRRADMRFSRDVDFFWFEQGRIQRGMDAWGSAGAIPAGSGADSSFATLRAEPLPGQA